MTRGMPDKPNISMAYVNANLSLRRYVRQSNKATATGLFIWAFQISWPSKHGV